MTSSILFRLVVSASLVPAFLPAQSAPMPAPAAAAQSPTTSEHEARLSARLAEVIAMLEQDDLTEDQRAAAKQKLQAIAAQLKPQRGAVRWKRTPEGLVELPRSAHQNPVEVAEVDPAGELFEVAEVPSPSNALAAPASPADAPTPPVVRLRRSARAQGGGEWSAQSAPGAAPVAGVPHGEVPVERAIAVEGEGSVEVAVPAPAERARVWRGRASSSGEGEWARVPQPSSREVAEEELERAHVARVRQRDQQAEESARDLREEAVRLRATADALRKATQEEVARQRRGRVAEVARARGGQASPFTFHGSGEGQTESVRNEEADLRAMVEDMRAEMKAIRELIQQMRVQSKRDEEQAKAGRAGAFGAFEASPDGVQGNPFAGTAGQVAGDASSPFSISRPAGAGEAAAAGQTTSSTR